MATYAALVSLTNLIDEVRLYHARQPIFTVEQLSLLESLQEKASFLQEFLGSSPHELTKEVQDLERRIADLAYRAEDIIESHVVDTKDARYTRTKKSYNHFSHLPEVIRFMNSIIKEAMKIKKKSGHPKDLVPVGYARSAPAGKDKTMVFDDELNQIMGKLIGEGSDLKDFQIFPITGMGGIGKTTLAKHVYDNAYIMEYFDIRGWITISQAYLVRELLLDLALGIGVYINQTEKEKIEYHQLVERIYQHLSGRRYLIIMDDMWSIDAWDKLRMSFPKNDNGSRIMVTTRLSNVANKFGSSDVYQMNLLDEDVSWRLLCTKVFIRESCPIELEKIGKKIAKNCKGLPLSVVVVGGLLAKSKMTRQYWEYVAENISTTVNLEDDESYLKVLSLSYSHLPIHLKPCFLYMAVFPEDYEIRVSELIKLLVAERFLKPYRGKSLEEAAEDYLKDLIDRNLIFVKLGYTGNLKICTIHDLLRDFCLREAHRERFVCVTMMHNCDSQGLKRRIAIHHSATHEKYWPHISYASKSTSLPRTVLSFTSDSAPSIDRKLLRIYSVVDDSLGSISWLMNSRYLKFSSRYSSNFPDSMDIFWNLQTLIVRNHVWGIVAPYTIWEMPQLRHIIMENVSLPDPPSGRTERPDDVALRNLQTLSHIYNFRCTEEVLRRIPYIKKLKVLYLKHDKGLSHYCPNNLKYLHKLQSLECRFMSNLNDWPTRSDLLQNLEFSPSLKKLTLWHCGLDWEDMATKIGTLPNLEKLKLLFCFSGEEWSPVDGQFLHLKFLEINRCDLVRWIADGTHFPCLEHLVLRNMVCLEEIPFDFGVIATLQSIMLEDCNSSVVTSAKEIREEQQNLGNEGLRLILVGDYGFSDEEEEGGGGGEEDEERKGTFLDEEEGRGEVEDVEDDEEEEEDKEEDDDKEAGEEEDRSRGFSACLGFIRMWIQ